MKLQEIIDLKVIGQDCTEEQSAEMKGYLREHWSDDTRPILFLAIMDLFPLEYGEVYEELEPSKK